MSPATAAATIEVKPVVTLDGFADSIKAAMATELRRLADELAPPAARYEVVLDHTGDYGIRDKQTGEVADYMSMGLEDVRKDVAALNAGTMRREDARDIDGEAWQREDSLYPPYKVIA